MLAYVRVGPGAVIGENCAVHEHAVLMGSITLEDDVSVESGAQLLGQVLRRPGIDGLDYLVALFQHLRLEGGGSLLAVPRTAVGSTQPRHDFQQAFHGLGRGSGFAHGNLRS